MSDCFETTVDAAEARTDVAVQSLGRVQMAANGSFIAHVYFVDHTWLKIGGEFRRNRLRALLSRNSLLKTIRTRNGNCLNCSREAPNFTANPPD